MLIFTGKSSISDFKFSKTFSGVLFNTSAKYIARIASNTTWEEYALVEATAISGPACVYIV